jgi:hypothetical protein
MRLTYLKSKFPRALPTKDGGVLRTVAEARSYIIALPKPRAQRQHWQHVARLIIEQADVAELGRLVHLALFLDGKLDQPPWTRRRRPTGHHSISGTNRAQ